MHPLNMSAFGRKTLDANHDACYSVLNSYTVACITLNGTRFMVFVTVYW
jgi:hypothetical protein